MPEEPIHDVDDVITEEGDTITLWQRVTLTIRDLDGKSVIDPVLIADAAIGKLTPELVHFGCILTLRQIARQILARQHDKKKGKAAAAADEAEEEPTFPGEDFSLLQTRYPKAHKNGVAQGYVVRDDMTKADWLWNLALLGREGEVKLQHQAQLKRWGETMKGFDEKAADPEE